MANTAKRQTIPSKIAPCTNAPQLHLNPCLPVPVPARAISRAGVSRNWLQQKAPTEIENQTTQAITDGNPAAPILQPQISLPTLCTASPVTLCHPFLRRGHPPKKENVCHWY